MRVSRASFCSAILQLADDLGGELLHGAEVGDRNAGRQEGQHLAGLDALSDVRDTALGDLDAPIHGRLHLSEGGGVGHDGADQLAALPRRLRHGDERAYAQQALRGLGQEHVAIGQAAGCIACAQRRGRRRLVGVIMSLVRGCLCGMARKHQRSDQHQRGSAGWATRAEGQRYDEPEARGDAGEQPSLRLSQ